MTDIYDLYGSLIASGQITDEEWDAALAEHDRDKEAEIARLRRSEATLLRDYETVLDERVGLQESIGRALGYMDAGVYSVARDELRAGLAELDTTPEHHPKPAGVASAWTDPEPWESAISTRVPKSRSRYQHDDFQDYKPRTREEYETQNGDPK